MTAVAAAIGPLQIVRAVVFSTHHGSAEEILAGRERPFTPPSYGLLVGRARRFTSLVTQLHLEVCGALAAGVEPSAVFATCHGEIQTAERLIADFRDAQRVSSARFALSVHNAASGLYSVATGSAAPTTTVTGDQAVAAGWLEAALTALDDPRGVVLSIADEPVPVAMLGPTEPAGIAAAFLLARAGTTGRRAQLMIAPRAEAANRPAIDLRHALAGAVAAVERAGATTLPLGWIQPGAMLELHVAPREAAA
jgi:hypothetical protein